MSKKLLALDNLVSEVLSLVIQECSVSCHIHIEAIKGDLLNWMHGNAENRSYQSYESQEKKKK